MSTEHRRLVNKALRLQHNIPGVRLWKNPVGFGYNGDVVSTFDKNGKRYLLLENPRPVTYGFCSGSSDIIGFCIKDKKPIFTGIEIKTPGDKRKPKQDDFHNMIISAGGFSGVVRKKEDLYEILGV